MDSHDDSRDSTNSSLTTFKVKTLKMIAAAPFKTQFCQSYRSHQNWSLPDSIMHYIAKNPATPRVYQKMVKSCNPRGRKCFDLDNIGCKFWITERVYVFRRNNINTQDIVSSVLPRTYRCDVEYLSIANQAFSYQDYFVLSTCAERIEFLEVTVKNEDGSITPLEKLIEVAPKLKRACFTSDTILSNITSNTVQKLVKLPNFLKLEYLELNPIPETFNLDAFYTYMKANTFTNFNLTFIDSLSNGYKNRLEEIVDELIEEDRSDYIPPYIYFDGLDLEKLDILDDLHR